MVYFPFGHYRFTDLMGPKLLDLPILLPLTYVGMGYLSWVLDLIILGCQNGPLLGRKIAWVRASKAVRPYSKQLGTAVASE